MNILIKFLFLFLLGCSSVSDKTKKNDEIVDINDLYKKKDIEISEKVPVNYGPSVIASDEVKTAEKKEKKLFSIDFYPALYKSFGYISVFKELELRELKPAVVSSFGFSSIVVALYAKNLKANIVEWKTYSLYQKLKDLKPYSKDWMDEIKTFLEKEFKDTKLSQLKILMLVPSIKKSQVYFSPTKLVRKALYKSIDLEKSLTLLVSGGKNYLKRFSKYGVEEAFRVSLLPREIKLKQTQSNLLNIYNNLNLINKSSENTFVQDYQKEVLLDSIFNLSDEINQAYDFSKDVSNQIENKIKK